MTSFLNSNTFHAFFSEQMPPHFPLQLNQEFLSDFEGYCQDGDLISIQNSCIDQQYIKNESDFLNCLLLSIYHRHYPVFSYLIALAPLHAIIQRNIFHIRHQLLSQGDIKFIKIFEQLFIDEYRKTTPLCNQSSVIAIEFLQCYYASKLRALSLASHKKKMLEMLARFYQQDSAYIKLADKTIVLLPLDLESFQIFRDNFDENTQKLMLKSYHSHTLHSCWRMLHSNQIWFESSKHAVYTSHLSKHQWLIILMWLAASDASIIDNGMTVEERCKLFFQRLTLVGDDSAITHQHLLQSVLSHPYTRVLTDEILVHEHEGFIERELRIKLHTMPKEELDELLIALKNNSILQTPELLAHIHIENTAIEQFEAYLSHHWGRQWQDNESLMTASREILSNEMTMIKRYPSLLMHTLKCLCQQSSSTSRFFNYNNKIKSMSPMSTDERVPLSYGVPERPKS